VASSFAERPADGAASKDQKRTIWSGALAGIGLAAFIDETVFHQLLHWHHFYDKSALAADLVSDGIFHAFGFTAMVAGLFLLMTQWYQSTGRELARTAPINIPATSHPQQPQLIAHASHGD
jgi:uncharacterized membrane protein